MYYCPKCKTYSVTGDKKCINCNTTYKSPEPAWYSTVFAIIILCIGIFGFAWTIFEFAKFKYPQ